MERGYAETKQHFNHAPRNSCACQGNPETSYLVVFYYLCEPWEELSALSQTYPMDWLIGGDFTEVLQAREKLGGNSINNKVRAFWNCLQKCNMIDLGYQGPKYTLTNKRW